VVVLSNTSGHAGINQMFDTAIAMWAFDRLEGAPQHDWSKEFLVQLQGKQRDYEKAEAELRRSRLQNVPPSLPLEQYAGTYEDRKGRSGRVNVRVENGRLELNFEGAGAYRASLEHWQSDLFRLHSNAGGADALGPVFADFSIDETGRTVSMSIDIARLKLNMERVASTGSKGTP
jgi:Domain of unknown function (DUF3471)